MAKNPPANAGYLGTITGLGRFPGKKEMAIHYSTLAWEIPWMEETGGLQSMVARESNMTGQLSTQACIIPVYLQMFRSDNKNKLVSPLI